MTNRTIHGLSAAVLAALAGAAPALGQIEVVYSSIATDPSSIVPNTGGQRFRANLSAMLTLGSSPDGTQWVFKAFLQGDADVILAGSGTSGQAIAVEFDAAPFGPDIEWGFFDSDVGINNAGVAAFGSRLGGAGVTTASDECIVTWDGSDYAFAAREGELAPGLFDSGTVGDETFGNSLNSPSVLTDGTVSFRADLINNIPTALRSACYIGSSVAVQEGTMILSGETVDSFAALDGNNFSPTSDGSAWIVEADIDPGTSSVEGAVVTGNVVLKDGDALSTGGIVDAIFGVRIADNGDWFVRGDYGAPRVDEDYVVKNGTVIIETGSDVPGTGGGEQVGDAIGTINTDPSGNWIITCNTNNADGNLDGVIIYNGTDVLAREGDMIDLNGNGMPDDDFFITSFNANDCFISSDGYAYFFATTRDGVGTNLRDAFLRVELPPAACAADWDNSGGQPNSSDFLAYLNDWSAQVPAADLAPPGGDSAWDSSDFLAYLNLYSAGC
ncbi:MAG: GC-type dockerin domain-anchored protein [Phycisphaerales bacterium]|jgi:hypothetical protein|nr:GC-type dockerin domain-anchored protein [Phycisphaerales bacterium]